jgi:hypothetical protein
MVTLFPDPGVLPTLPPPNPGERILISLEGEPPRKDVSFSIRNPKHPRYETFLRLRQEATRVMNCRKWYDGPVRLVFTYYSERLERRLIDYLGGVTDRLDGSHGLTFTYLPVVFQDDCQVCDAECRFVQARQTAYTVEVIFLE